MNPWLPWTDGRPAGTAAPVVEVGCSNRHHEVCELDANLPGSDDSAGVTTPASDDKERIARLQTRLLIAYLACAGLISLAVALLGARLSPIALGLVLLASLTLAGIAVFARLRWNSGNRPVTTLRRELDQTRRDYERLFTAVPCFICVLGRDHRIIEANALYRKEFGATDRSLCYEVCKKRTTQCPDCIVDKTFADGRIHSNEETLITRDGDRVNVVVHTRPVFDNQGEITAVMEVFTDITEVKKLQRQLALMGRAVAGMAHRVKNILMGLEGGIFVVNTGFETDDRASIDEGWEMVERNVQRVSRIVKDLLYCSKDRPPAFSDNVCPHDIVLEVRDLFADRMREEDIHVRTELSQPPHRGTFDPEALHSLMCNLVANAIDACRFDPSEDKEHHNITLRCRQNDDGGTILEVEDDGAGIPEGLNNKVFEDFFSSKGTEGTGIGLLVVQKVVEEHGGKVSFDSSPGRGTTFTVHLPSRPPAKSHGELLPPVEATTSRSV
jgi:PAS domain S-box-containing protein